MVGSGAWACVALRMLVQNVSAMSGAGGLFSPEVRFWYIDVTCYVLPVTCL